MTRDVVVPPVLERGSGSALEEFADFRPLRSVLLVLLEEELLLLTGPFIAADAWTKVVLVPISALSTGTTGHGRGNVVPLMGAVLFDEHA